MWPLSFSEGRFKSRIEAAPCGQCILWLRGPEFWEARCPIAGVLLECCLRFLEERKEIMAKFAKEQDAFLRDAQEKHSQELQLLQQGHQQQLLALRTELETKHCSELREQLASLESRQQALLETHVAELQVKHDAEISALEKRHLSNLDELESCYMADVQTIRDEHKRALELLRVELEEQLQKKDSCHREILTQELEKLKLKHAAELQSVRDSLSVNLSAQHTENRKGPATDVQGAHQVRCQGHVLRLRASVPLLVHWPHARWVWVFVVYAPACLGSTSERVFLYPCLLFLCVPICIYVYISELAHMCVSGVSVCVHVCLCVSEPHGQLIAVLIYGLTVDGMVTVRVGGAPVTFLLIALRAFRSSLNPT